MKSFEGRFLSRQALALLLLALLILTFVLGCSNPDNPATVGEGVGDAFARKALAVCASAQESKDAWSPFPAPDFDPNKPDSSKFPEVGAWLETEVGPTFDAWRDELTALGTPPTGREAWTDVLTAVARIARLNTDQVEASKSDDADAFVNATNGLQAVQTELERATGAAGVAKCAEVHAG